jgi:short-subunit dehydrogenase
VIDALGSVGSLLLAGGTSDIAVATAKRYLQERPLRVVVAARDTPRRAVVADQLRAAGATVEVVDFEADDPGSPAFYSGLADSLAGTGVSVLVVRPGFVRSKMTEGLPDAPLATTPEAVAEAIVAGVRKGRHTVWVPGAMRWVMSGLRHTPRALFRRLPI